MRRDPYQLVLAGLSLTRGALPRTVRRWEEAVQAVIAARHPLTQEERAVIAAADKARLIPAMLGPEQSRYRPAPTVCCKHYPLRLFR